MRIEYIDHSGFFVEMDTTCLLFDFDAGTPPKLPDGKRLLVFASHHHPDHLSPNAFAYGNTNRAEKYLLGCDVTLSANNCAHLGIAPEMLPRCVRMHKDDVVTVGNARIRALRSNDMGVAFLVECDGKRIYHGGDHSLWIWHQDANFDKSQVEHFYFEIEKLRGLKIDAAFLPLDPRLGEEYWRGFDAFARLIEPEALFPMHMVGDYDIIRRLKELPCSAPYRSRIAEIRANGDTFEV